MLDILFLSFIQGITEFLPVSSSGHLIIFPYILGMGSHSLEVDGMVHMGTLMAVLLYFYRDLLSMCGSFFAYIFKKNIDPNLVQKVERETLLCISLVIATIPVVFAGLVAKRWGLDFLRTPFVIGGASIVGGLLLYGADRFAKQEYTLNHMTFYRAFIIGIFQILSLVPGSSRSGMCLTGARLLGMERSDATRFAFLLSIPAILGAFTLIFLDAYMDGLQTPLMDLLGYFVFSFIFGFCAIHFMMRYVQKHSFFIFMAYRVILGIVILCMHI